MGNEYEDSIGRILALEESEIANQLRVTRSVLAERERELLEIKGPCSRSACQLHYAHSGPCDIEKAG